MFKVRLIYKIIISERSKRCFHFCCNQKKTFIQSETV